MRFLCTGAQRNSIVYDSFNGAAHGGSRRRNAASATTLRAKEGEGGTPHFARVCATASVTALCSRDKARSLLRSASACKASSALKRTSLGLGAGGRAFLTTF